MVNCELILGWLLPLTVRGGLAKRTRACTVGQEAVAQAVDGTEPPWPLKAVRIEQVAGRVASRARNYRWSPGSTTPYPNHET